VNESANRRVSDRLEVVSNQRLAVIGLGNPLRGDDGVGSRLVEELTRRGLPEGVTALDGGTGGLDLLHMLEGCAWQRAVIVDAADVGRKPGQFVRFTPDQARLVQTADNFSLHHAGLSEVLALANALGQTLPDLVIFGVQPAQIGWGEGLSQAVETALPALTDAILLEITGQLPEGENYAQDSGD
jgi:hydrogenase maturation protease